MAHQGPNVTDSESDYDAANVIAWIAAAFIVLIVTLMTIRSLHE